MTTTGEGRLLWTPSEEVKRAANLTRYMNWLAANRGQTFTSYHELWGWSVDNLADFWESIWATFDVKAARGPTIVLADRKMPGARWFVGARLNIAENYFARAEERGTALIYKAEDRPLMTLTWAEIRSRTAALGQALRAMGVGAGDRVVAYLPNVPEAVIAFLATASIGAIWSSCSPDFGSRGVLDRFQQIEPKVLLATDGYQYNGNVYDRLQTITELQAGLPTLEKTILIPLITDGRESDSLPNTLLWDELLADDHQATPLEFEQVPFDHPLWVLYTSGTTGLPKPIVHGHGGILLEHLKYCSLSLDLKPSDRFFWYTSTGWMVWNLLIGGLLTGCTIVLYDGSPGYPDLYTLWELAEEAGITFFGASAAYIGACMKADIRPAERFDLHQIRAVGSTGSPLTVEGFEWVYHNVDRDLALASVSGGTDLCTAIVGGCRILPIYAGEIRAAMLGAKVEAFNEEGEPVIDQVGELVITEPMPSMPLYFWHDPGNRRYRASYFETFPGTWRHGDWIKFTRRGSCVIYGRSDSTIKRRGVRMGTSEIYQVVESLPEILDSLVVDLEMLGRKSYMPLFVVLREGTVLDRELKERIADSIRREISPRYVPDEILAIEQVPYTLSGKKMEVPVRRILLGQPAEEVASRGTMRNSEDIRFFIDLAKRWQRER
jgi:acetoacetyl-CoA synthetase